MTELIFKLDGWDCGSLPPELSATYTRLLIQSGDTTISRTSNRSTNSVSDTLYLPVYPLAAWIAANWWRLLYDCNSLRNNNEYALTHNIKFAGEGYFLPDMLIVPDGENMAMLNWRPWSINNGALTSIETGSKLVSMVVLQKALTSVVQAVIERLRERGISDTALQQDWEAVCASSADREESAFCIACARLGKDPYDVDEALAETIVAVHRQLDSKIQLEEVLSSSDALHLKETSERLCELLSSGNVGNVDAMLEELRDRCSRVTSTTPWGTGYEQAKIAREILRQHNINQKNLCELTYESVRVASIPNELVSLASPSGFIANRPPVDNFFVLGRMLGAFICSADKAIPVTGVYTAEQKRQRAFSAELYVPAEELKRRFAHTATVGEDTVTEVAEEYGINPLVVKHQLENHGIADVV